MAVLRTTDDDGNRIIKAGSLGTFPDTAEGWADYKAAKAARDAANSSSSSSSSSSSGSSSPPPATTPSTSSSNSSELDALLNDSNLTDAEQDSIRAVYDAVAAGDAQRAEEMIARLELAGQYADPILKRQIALISDELNRTVQAIGEDLEYDEQKYQNRLQDIKDDVAYNREQLSIQEQSELKKLERYFGEKLVETRDTMASRGMTSSRKREYAEEILAEQKGEMIEGTKREFATAQREQILTGERSERDIQTELERLQQLSDRKATSVLRSAEDKLGTQRLSQMDALGNLAPIGDIEGQVDLDYRDTLADFAF